MQLRPTNSTMDRTAVIEEITNDISQWQGSKYLGDIREDVTKMLNKNPYAGDGYELARWMENYCSYNPDETLVEILGGVYSTVSQELTKQEQQWVIDNNIKPKFSIGTAVKYQERGEVYDAEVLKIREDTGYYVIHTPALGHKKEGVGVHGCVVAFEKCEEYQEKLKTEKLRTDFA